MVRASLILSFDDASKYILKAAKLIEKYGFKGTFYLDIALLLKTLNTSAIKDLHLSGHEIGSHTVTHADLTKLGKDQVVRELKESKEVLERIIDDDVRTFAYPYGRYNNVVKELVKLVGYGNARTTDPFNVYPQDIKDPYAVGVTFYADPHAIRQIFKVARKLKYFKVVVNPLILKRYDLFIKDYLDHVVSERIYIVTNVCINILVHPTFLAERDDWNRFESLLQYLASVVSKSFTISEYLDYLRGMC